MAKTVNMHKACVCFTKYYFVNIIIKKKTLIDNENIICKK